MNNKNQEHERDMEQGGLGQGKEEQALVGNNSSSSSRTEDFVSIMEILLLIVTFPVTLGLPLLSCLRRVNQYERGIIFRFGKLKKGGLAEPGLHFIKPFTENMVVVDIRTTCFDVPPQQILTRDSVSVNIDAVVYCHVTDPVLAVCKVQNYIQSIRLLATTTVRTILGTKTLDELLCDRENIAKDIFSHMDAPIRPWGVQVERVELKDVQLPVQLQRAMAAEAEATRDAKAKIIAARGEQDASHALNEAATVIDQSRGAMQLRYLQTLHAISAEKNSTIVFPLPMDILSLLTNPKKS